MFTRVAQLKVVALHGVFGMTLVICISRVTSNMAPKVYEALFVRWRIFIVMMAVWLQSVVNVCIYNWYYSLLQHPKTAFKQVFRLLGSLCC